MISARPRRPAFNRRVLPPPSSLRARKVKIRLLRGRSDFDVLKSCSNPFKKKHQNQQNPISTCPKTGRPLRGPSGAPPGPGEPLRGPEGPSGAPPGAPPGPSGGLRAPPGPLRGPLRGPGGPMPAIPDRIWAVPGPARDPTSRIALSRTKKPWDRPLPGATSTCTDAPIGLVKPLRSPYWSLLGA